MKTRIYFLDNLRTLLIFLVVLLHAGIVYEPILENMWIVSDPVKNSSIGLIRMYLDLFVMFTLFFISGYFIPDSIKNKTNFEFIASKFKRIILPWIVAVFTMIPAYKIIFLYSRGLPQEEWYSYFHLFQRTGGDLSSFADNPVQNWLWFLPVLFLFQMLYLGISKSNLLRMDLSVKTSVILTIILGVVYGIIISELEIRGWYHSAILHFQRERFAVYFMAFLLGSLCNKRKVFEAKSKNKKLYLWANVVLTPALGLFTVVALNMFFNMIDPSRNYFFISEFIDRLGYYTFAMLSIFSILYILIYVFRFNLNKTNAIMQELNSNSYGVYIIHLPIIGLVALLFMRLAIPVYIKFSLVTLLAFIISNLSVFVYRRIFRKLLSASLYRLVIPLVAGLLSIAVYMNQTTSTHSNNTEIDQKESSNPRMGLHRAVIDGNIDIVRQHIQIGSDLDIAEPSGGSSPLILAALYGETAIAQELINAGADINLKNKEGSTPLITAAFFCHAKIVDALLAKGADIDLKNNSGSTALVSVSVPFESVESIYKHFENTLGPLGLRLDYEKIRKNRPIIAETLQEHQGVVSTDKKLNE